MAGKHNSSRSRKVFSRGMKLFVALVIASILAVAGVTLVVWPEALSTIGTLAGLAATAVFAWVWDKIKAEIKEFKERLKDTEDKADRAETKAVEEGERNNVIEATATEASKRADRASNRADSAATTAQVLAVKVDDNSERARLLEIRSEALSDMAYKLTENLQQVLDKSEIRVVHLEKKLEALEVQNEQQQIEMDELKNTHKREIAELHAQISKMGKDSAGDKAEITALRARVTELETRVAVLDAENSQLKNENRELRGNQRRMITGQLTGLSPDVEERLNHLEKERQEAKGDVT